MKKILGIYILPLILTLGSCTATDHLAIPAFNAQNELQAVVEIPAGTNHKIEYVPEERKFVNDIRDGEKRIIDFLPYPVNYGFIPATKMDKARGGDGDPLDILVIAEAIPSGTVVSVIPIGMIRLKDQGEMDDKIIAVPAIVGTRIISATDFESFDKDYKAIQTILKEWFLAYDQDETMEFIGFGDEKAAMAEIRKWQVRP